MSVLSLSLLCLAFISVNCLIALGESDHVDLELCHKAPVGAAVAYGAESFIVFFGSHYSVGDIANDEVSVRRGFPKRISGPNGDNWFKVPQLAKAILGAYADGPESVVIATAPHLNLFKFNVSNLDDIRLTEVIEISNLPHSTSAMASVATSSSDGAKVLVLFYWFQTEDDESVMRIRTSDGFESDCHVAEERKPPTAVAIFRDLSGLQFNANGTVDRIRVSPVTLQECVGIEVMKTVSTLNSSVFKGCESNQGQETAEKSVVKRHKLPAELFQTSSARSVLVASVLSFYLTIGFIWLILWVLFRHFSIVNQTSIR